MASGEEPKQVNFYGSSDGANPETIKAVQDGIQEVLNKFKDAQGVVYLNIETLHLYPDGPLHHGPPSDGHPHHRFGRDGHPHLGFGHRGPSHDGSPRHYGRPDHPPSPYSGHPGYGFPHHGFSHHGRLDLGFPHHGPSHFGFPGFGPQHQHLWWGQSRHEERHSRGRHGHRRHHYWWPSPPCAETTETSGEETGCETNGVDISQAPCWYYCGRRHGRGRHGRSRSRSRSRSRCCKKIGKENNEPVDLTENDKEGGEKDLQEKFDNMDVKSP